MLAFVYTEVGKIWQLPRREIALAVIALGATVFCAIFILVSSVGINVVQHFTLLAESFLQGKLYFVQLDGERLWNDISYFNGRGYWALGPLPAVLLLLPVFFFRLFRQPFIIQYLQPFVVFWVSYLVYRLGKLSGLSNRDALYFIYAFMIGSALVGVVLIPSPYFFSSLLTTALICSALVEYLTKRRYLLIGIAIALAAATRLTSVLTLLFFVAEILGHKTTPSFKSKQLLKLLIPVGLVLLLLGWYNFARFGNWFESGYSYQLLLTPQHERARSYGLFNLIHVPGNLYNALLVAPQPVFRDGISQVLKYPFISASPWGLGLFFTSPYLLALFFVWRRNRESALALATIIVMFVPLLFYYGIGYAQFGYRYALDFYPLLFWLWARAYAGKGFSFNLRSVVVISGVVNLYMLMSLLAVQEYWGMGQYLMAK